MSPQSRNHTETLLASLGKALNHLKEPEILKESPLLGLPAVAAKEYCKLQGCVHDYPYDCLVKAIRYLVETRVKNWQNLDQIWRGCLLLALHRIYPSFVNKQVKIEIKHLSGLREGPQLDLEVASAIDYVEQELLNKQSVWLLFGEFPRERAIFNLLKLARTWLLAQLQNDPAAIILMTRQLFRHQCRNFMILGGETIDFDERSVMPQLKPRGSQNERYTLEEILRFHPREGIYIYGPTGTGKTTLYRYAVWLLSPAYLLTASHTLINFPYPWIVSSLDNLPSFQLRVI